MAGCSAFRYLCRRGGLGVPYLTCLRSQDEHCSTLANRQRGQSTTARNDLHSLLDSRFPLLEPLDLSPDGVKIQNEAVTAGNLDLAFRGAEEVLVAALGAPAQDLQAAELR